MINYTEANIFRYNNTEIQIEDYHINYRNDSTRIILFNKVLVGTFIRNIRSRIDEEDLTFKVFAEILIDSLESIQIEEFQITSYKLLKFLEEFVLGIKYIIFNYYY